MSLSWRIDRDIDYVLLPKCSFKFLHPELINIFELHTGNEAVDLEVLMLNFSGFHHYVCFDH